MALVKVEATAARLAWAFYTGGWRPDQIAAFLEAVGFEHYNTRRVIGLLVRECRRRRR